MVMIDAEKLRELTDLARHPPTKSHYEGAKKKYRGGGGGGGDKNQSYRDAPPY